MKNRILSFLTSMAILFTFIVIPPVSAEETQTTPTTSKTEVKTNDNLSVEGTNSFGKMLAETVREKQEEQTENNGNNIFSVEMDGKTAKVDMQTTADSMLVVAIYDDEGKKMLASGNKEVTSADENVEVEIKISAMPQYYYVRAFLADKTTCKPLCKAYSTPNYTQKMQEFFSKTTDDFDQEKVFNLDDDKTNNFAVYGDDTKVIPFKEGVNTVATADDTNLKYVIKNADSNITSLKKGDTFAYNYDKNEGLIIVKIAEITTNGDTVTIKGEDTDFKDVFEYIRIDAESNSDNVTYDNSKLGEGVTCVSTSNNKKVKNSSKLKLVDEKKSEEIGPLTYNLEREIDDNCKLSGSLSLTGEIYLKLYLASDYQSVEMKFTLIKEISVTLSLSGKAIDYILTYIYFDPVAFVHISFAPTFIVEGTIDGTIKCTATNTIGFRVSSDSGITNLSESKIVPDIEINADVFIGVSINPTIAIVHKKVAYVKCDAKIGVDVSAKLSYLHADPDIQVCKACIDGDATFKIEPEFEVCFLNDDDLKETLTFTIEYKIGDFYFSIDHMKFGWGECPYHKYRLKIKVKDSDGKPIENVKIRFGGQDADDVYTDKSGYAQAFISGNCIVNIIDDEKYYSASKSLWDVAEPTEVEFTLTKRGVPDDDTSSIDFNVTDSDKLSLGDDHSAAINSDGSLYTWGDNDAGQLGDGTMGTIDNKYTPQKINVDNKKVKSVSFGGWHSAAITEDGCLYTWGGNDYGQLGELGDGTTNYKTTPQKINVDNKKVKAVSLGDMHSAAITEDGCLYTWGSNYRGQLGDGTSGYDAYKITPQKINVDNKKVKAVSLGSDHSAAITEDGCLYTWGYNDNGQLGNGTSGEEAFKTTPQKINVDNKKVKAVSLGDCHSAAITEDGCLYTWGSNYRGQLGDGTTTDKTTPQKINVDNKKVKAVGLGFLHSAAITEDGCLYTWGHNWCGQLGDGTTTKKTIPQKINVDNKKVKALSLGDEYSAAITEDGCLYTWGSNSDGQLGYETEDANNDGLKDGNPTPRKVTIPTTTTKNSPKTKLAAAPKMAANTENGTVKTFTGLEKNKIYNVYAFKSKDAENIFDSDNLLYVNQYKTDENGNINVEYGLTEEYENPVWVAVEYEITDISNANVKVENLTYNGKTQYVNPVVTLNGETLVKGKDYYISGDRWAVKPGTYTIEICGKGLYTGTVSAKYTVTEKNHSFGKWTVTKKPTCTTKGERQRKCSVCGKIEMQTINALGHKFVKSKVVKPTVNSQGYTLYKCSACGATVKKDFVAKLKKPNSTSKPPAKKFSIKKAKVKGLTAKSYTGKQIKPKIKVVLGKKVLKNGRDYTLKFGKNKSVGKGTVTIIGKGKYGGKITKSFKILPAKTSAKLSSTKGKIKVTLKKVKGAKKYQIQYATNKKFKGAKKITTTATKKSFKAKSKKIYYVRVRSVNGKYVSGWSAIKKIKVK